MPDTPQQQTPRATMIGVIGATVAATLVVVLLVVEIVTVGTGRPGGAPAAGTVPAASSAAPAAPAVPPLSAEARAALDSGNVAYRAGRYRDALALYRKVAADAPGDAAPYFGIYMAATKLGEHAVADSALTVIRQNTTTGGQMLSDSALRALHQGGAAAPKKP